MSDTPQGETQEEYEARIRAVPGIFNDRNESAHAVYTNPAVALQEAHDLAEVSDLAPDPHTPSEDTPSGTVTLDPGVYYFNVPVEVPADADYEAIDSWDKLDPEAKEDATQAVEAEQAAAEAEQEDPDELLKLKRVELNEKAENEGVEDPASLPNKGAVVDAIVSDDDEE